MINPYENVDWSTAESIVGVTHQHLSHTKTLTQSTFDQIYNTGVRHFAISRYRPSLTTYPFDYTNNTFDYVANSFDSTESVENLIANDSVAVSFQSDVIGCPNAEHVYSQLYLNGGWYKWNNVHINGLGSFYQSGLTPNASTGYGNTGVNAPYTTCIDNIISNLQYTDGGGAIINHPGWTEANTHKPFNVVRFIEDCLDYDPRVLGIDVIEGGSQARMTADLAKLDQILATGRRCWVFGIGDWSTTRGRNILLVPTQNSKANYEHAVLQAYRNGSYYVKYANSDLRFTQISVEDSNGIKGADFLAMGADGIILTVNGASYDYPNPNGRETLFGIGHSTTTDDVTYIRAMAYQNRDDDPDWEYKDSDIYKDVIISQPIIFKEKTYPYRPLYDDVQQKSNVRPLWLWG